MLLIETVKGNAKSRANSIINQNIFIDKNISSLTVGERSSNGIHLVVLAISIFNFFRNLHNRELFQNLKCIQREVKRISKVVSKITDDRWALVLAEFVFKTLLEDSQKGDFRGYLHLTLEALDVLKKTRGFIGANLNDDSEIVVVINDEYLLVLLLILIVYFN